MKPTSAAADSMISPSRHVTSPSMMASNPLGEPVSKVVTPSATLAAPKSSRTAAAPFIMKARRAAVSLWPPLSSRGVFVFAMASFLCVLTQRYHQPGQHDRGQQQPHDDLHPVKLEQTVKRAQKLLFGLP